MMGEKKESKKNGRVKEKRKKTEIKRKTVEY